MLSTMEKYHLDNKDGYKIKPLLLFNTMHYYGLNFFKIVHMGDPGSFNSVFSSMLQRMKKKKSGIFPKRICS